MGLTASSVFKLIPTRVTIESLDTLLSDYPRKDFQVRLWDGSSWGETQTPRFTLTLKDPAALQHLLYSPSELTLGESYIFDELDIEGDIEASLEVGDYLLSSDKNDLSQTPLLAKLLAFPSRKADPEHGPTLHGEVHSRERDRQAIRYHYDQPAEFFALWLDRRRVYSSGFFEDENTDLDTAQYRKLDYVCRKLGLHRGERFLDIGCGWGGLLLYAAAQFGVEAVGITLSVSQAEIARERIRQAGLNDRCRVELCDYRDIEIGRKFDKAASIGMFEHVGERNLAEYFSQLWRLLRPGGAFLNSGIAAAATYKRQGPSFIDRYVFPDGDLVPINSTLEAAERCGFEIRDVESLREHYALTLHHWVRRLEQHAEEARAITDETTYRIWRLYMAGSAHGFRTGRMNLYHTLMSKDRDGDSGMPLTRSDWYRQ